MILFDSPPLVPVIDAAIISAYADGVVLVASSGLSKIDLLKHAKEILDRVDAKLLGVAFNNYHMAKGYFGEPYHYEYQPSEAPVRDIMETPVGRRRTGNRVRIMKVNK